jgi:uncharacterized protein YbjT (DUF2867 family)
LFLGRVYADKDVQERIIRKSRLDWTIVRPTILTNGPHTGAYRVLVDPNDWTSGFISRADVADFLVKQIDDNSLSPPDARADQLTRWHPRQLASAHGTSS